MKSEYKAEAMIHSDIINKTLSVIILNKGIHKGKIILYVDPDAYNASYIARIMSIGEAALKVCENTED